jgi:hypothetical protein
MMTVVPGQLERDAALPSIGDQFDIVLGPLSGVVAECKQQIREVFSRESVSCTSFWRNASRDLFPTLDTHDADLLDVKVVVLSERELASAQEGLDIASRIVQVHIPIPDE